MKKFLIGFFAVLFIAATAFATVSVPSNQVVDDQWYEYLGGPLDQESSYRPLDGMPQCNGEGDLCAVKVHVVNGTPDFNTIIDSRNKE